jgi:hypothetical protein
MPDLQTFEDFDRLLAATRIEIDRLVQAEPEDGALKSVQAQLGAVHAWTRGGREPGQGEKDSLNFGMIASRALDNYDVADDLYRLASFITWWGPGRY